MRIWMAAAMVLGLSAGSAHAQPFDDPKALVSSIFDPYTHGQQPADLADYYSEGLRKLFVRYTQQTAYMGVGTQKVAATSEPTFDPFVNARHYLLLDLTIGDPVIEGDHATVSVSYKNFDHPSVLGLSLVKAADGWKVDDVASLGADDHWLLSWLLEYDPTGVH